jgi:hypothetical protein
MNLSTLVEIIEDIRAEEGDLEVRFIGPYNDYEIEQIELLVNEEGQKYMRLGWRQA